MSDIKTLDDFNFHTYITYVKLPVLVCFRASFCRFDRLVDGLLALVGEQYKDRLLVFSANVDEALNVLSKFDIRFTPTYCFFNAGELISKRPGSLSKEQLFAYIDVCLFAKGDMDELNRCLRGET